MVWVRVKLLLLFCTWKKVSGTTKLSSETFLNTIAIIGELSDVNVLYIVSGDAMWSKYWYLYWLPYTIYCSIPNTVYWYLVFFYLLLLFFRLETRINASFSSHIYILFFCHAAIAIAPFVCRRYLWPDKYYNTAFSRFYIPQQTYAVIIVYDSESDKL